MAYNYEYPYTDPNRYNSDWVLKKITGLLKEWEGISEEFTNLKDKVDDFFNWVKWKFENLDVNEAVYEQIQKMYEDGTLAVVINSAIEMLNKNSFDYYQFFNSKWIGMWAPSQGGCLGKGVQKGYAYLGFSSTGMSTAETGGLHVILQKVQLSSGDVVASVTGSENRLGHINGVTYNPDLDRVYVAVFPNLNNSTAGVVDVYDGDLNYIESIYPFPYQGKKENIMDVSYWNNYLWFASADSVNGNTIYQYSPHTGEMVEAFKLPSYSLQFCSMVNGKLYANSNMEVRIFDNQGNFLETKFLDLTSKDKSVYLQETEWIDCDEDGNLFLGLSESTFRTAGYDFRHIICSLSKSFLDTKLSPFGTVKPGNSYHISTLYSPVMMGYFSSPFDCINRACRLASTLGNMININCHKYNYNENVILEGNAMLQDCNTINTLYVRGNSLGQNVSINGNYGNYFYNVLNIGVSGTQASSLVIEHGVTYSQYGGTIQKQQPYSGYPVWCSGYYTPINVSYITGGAAANVYFYATQNSYVGTTSICSFPSITNTQTKGNIKDSGVSVATNSNNTWTFTNLTLSDNQTFKVEVNTCDMRGVWQSWLPEELTAGGVACTTGGLMEIYSAVFKVVRDKGNVRLILAHQRKITISPTGTMTQATDFDIGIIRIVPF